MAACRKKENSNGLHNNTEIEKDLHTSGKQRSLRTHSAAGNTKKNGGMAPSPSRGKAGEPSSVNNASLPKQTSSSSSSAAKTDNNAEETDSLKIYYRHLNDSEPMPQEDEFAVWQKIEESRDEIRRLLYRFGFVFQEHIKILETCSEENMDDVFRQSALPPEIRNMNQTAFLFSHARPWGEMIAGTYERLKGHFLAGNSDELRKEREKGIGLLMRYPMHSNLLREWYKVAQIFLMSLEIHEGHSSLAEKVLPGKKEEVEAKLLMDIEEFKTTMRALEKCFQSIEEYQNRILIANLRLVVSLVRHYRNSSVQTGDLIQEGNLGLIHATEKFDYRLGHKFSTYATWWIKQSISKAVASQSRVIRLPSHMLQAISKINRAEQNYILLNGCDPSDEELASILQMPRERVSAIKKMACQAISLQAPLSNSDGAFLENLISEGESADPAKKLAFKMMCSRLKTALDTLTEREQQIIKLRFGLSGNQPMTLVEVSKIFNLTRERIRQLEYKAIKKLRDPALMVYFQDYFS